MPPFPLFCPASCVDQRTHPWFSCRLCEIHALCVCLLTRCAGACIKPLCFRRFLIGTVFAITDLKYRAFNFMARKLYIFTPTGRMKMDGPQNTSFKWLGGYTAS